MTANDEGGLRIGELARLADTTPRAVRHYHQIGLLAEPRRDESGYRRYGPEHLVRLVRIRRLRSLDMPLEQVARALADDAPDGDLTAALRGVAADLAEEIERLQALRARVLDMAAAQTLPDPGAAWSGELRKRGVLGESTPLPPSEQAAADLLDALHPEGIQGAIQQAAALMADPARTARLGPLLGRLEALRDDAGDDVVEALAAEWAAVLPTGSKLPPAVDVDTMDALLGHRLSPAKRRCLRRIRELVEAPGR